VRDQGLWDYKLQAPNGHNWEDFGNYHYGATGAATGLFTPQTLLREAGKNQCDNGRSDPKWGTPLDPPYGDDINDQYWIKEGISDYYSGMYGNPAKSPIYKDVLRSLADYYSRQDAQENYRAPNKNWYRNNPSLQQ
jgi:hypothetical protein